MNFKDRLFGITHAPARHSTIWRPAFLKWEAFAQRALNFLVTDETAAQFAAMPKERQTAIKDVGGFVGGIFEGERRKKEELKYRSLLTLDYDGLAPEHYDTLKSHLVSLAYIIYSTHSHTQTSIRIRLCVPLDRDVTPAEYEQLSRSFAARIGEEGIDSTTHDPCRLMFWASRSCDAPYIAIKHDGSPLRADDFLLRADDFLLRAPAPEGTATQAPEEVYRMLSRAQDPTTKPGLIGAFCRVYDIPKAIETFIPECYTRVGRNRFTYNYGSTAGGAVMYDNGKWLFSNHATDPCSMKLVNSYDLVRLHRSLSKEKMAELMLSDKAVAKELNKESRAAFKDLDLGYPEEAEPLTPAWEERLTRNKRGIEATRPNIMLILDNHPDLSGKIRRNLFSGRDEIAGTMPWTRGESNEWSNDDDAGLRCWLESRYGISGKDAIADAFNAIVNKNRFHPVRDYLDTLQWDGTKRLEHLVIDALGAEDIPLVRALTRIIFVAAVARVYRPGCKYDYCVVLLGPEGTGKSTLLKIMAGDWFSDSLTSFEGKDAMEAIQGIWISEIGEMNAYDNSRNNVNKQFISSSCDNYRPAYGRRTERRPRQCVFVGTTNEEYFLRSLNGDRRFPIIEIRPELRHPAVTDIPCMTELVAATRDQLWAEAKHLYEQGSPLYLSAELEAEARAGQRAHSIKDVDPIQSQVLAFLDTLLPCRWREYSLEERRRWLNSREDEREPGTVRRTQVCVMEIMRECLGFDPRTPNYRHTSLDVARILNTSGEWVQEERKFNLTRIPIYGRQRMWTRCAENV